MGYFKINEAIPIIRYESLQILQRCNYKESTPGELKMKLEGTEIFKEFEQLEDSQRKVKIHLQRIKMIKMMVDVSISLTRSKRQRNNVSHLQRK